MFLLERSTGNWIENGMVCITQFSERFQRASMILSSEDHEDRFTSNLPFATFAIQQGLGENIQNVVALPEIQTPEHF